MEDDSKREVDEEYDIMMKDESSLESDEEYDNEDDATQLRVRIRMFKTRTKKLSHS